MNGTAYSHQAPPGDLSQHHLQHHQHMPMANGAASGYPSNYYQQHQLPPPQQLSHGSLPPPHGHQQPLPHPHQHPSQQSPPQPSQQQQQLPPPHHLQQHHIHQQQPTQHQLPPYQPQRQPAMSEKAPATPAAPATLIENSRHIFSKVDEHTNRKYELKVVQQPRRARMCGFGDKDRRPITPPPCVRLIITDATTGKEIDVNDKNSDIDYSMFVLNVDLWNEDGSQEVNLVRSSAGTPSISSTVPYSYAALNDRNDPNHVQFHQSVAPNTEFQSSGVPYGQDYAQQPPGYSRVSSSYTQNGSYGPPQQYYPQHGYRADGVPPLPGQGNLPPYSNGNQPGFPQDQNTLTRMAVVGGQPQGMFTRNLIGSLAASAFRLNDTHERIGIWFVLQDLSVRTEGPFRLRFSFVNVGPPRPRAGGPPVNQGKAPILASTFSDVFNVYSAKKFPGVCESTSLSKAFAAQGIKIPIRKDSNVKGEDGNDDEE